MPPTRVCPICPHRAAWPVAVVVTRPSYWPGQPPVSEGYCTHHGQIMAREARDYGLTGVTVTAITNGS